MEKKKRNIIQEVQSVKSREQLISQMELINQLNDTTARYKEIKDRDADQGNVFLKYLPITAVACFEAFFKGVVKELIEHGDPFNKRITNFNQSNIKMDFEMLLAIQSKFFTVGDLVTHLLAFNNLGDINFNLSVILGDDFLKSLKNFDSKEHFKEYLDSKFDFSTNFDKVIVSINKIFELRNIICHEFSSNIILDSAIIVNHINNCSSFLTHCSFFIDRLLYPHLMTQAEMNTEAKETFEICDNELDELILQIKNIDKSDTYYRDEKLFDKSIVYWRKYRLLRAEYSASRAIGGSIYPFIYSLMMETTTREKIDSLTTEFSINGPK